jgi:cysteinyl-tRNA synthetase
MALKLHNTLTKTVDLFQPLNPELVTIYSCGPTVYDHAHIGNLSAFITADTLRRVISANDYRVKHVMNFTDVDDKTIRRSRENYPNLEAMEALRTLTQEYSDLFLQDMQTIGNDTNALHFIKAADDSTIDGMRQMIEKLHNDGFAYVADDGVYFSIDAYKKSGKKYGQLVELTESNTSAERIQNDEYDKDSAHDFALWKKKKPGEPAWEFALDGHDLTGRPGWHIECSVMSKQGLGQPFDIHTGGIDLAFPHHENEIAQSTAGHDEPTYAKVFVHNEHILVDGKKMSKSLGNFYTLQDLIDKNVDPLAFRLLVLQSHYRKPTSFSLENVEAARHRLKHWREVAALRHQTHDTINDDSEKEVSLRAAPHALLEALNDDLNTPEALTIIDWAFAQFVGTPLA